MQDFLDLTGWRKVADDEVISIRHLNVWWNDTGLKNVSMVEPGPHFTPFKPEDAFKWDNERILRHEFYVPVLPDQRPGAILRFVSATGREGVATALYDGRWGVIYLGGLPAALYSTSALLREVSGVYELVSPGREYADHTPAEAIA